jgi:hypothetical protein
MPSLRWMGQNERTSLLTVGGGLLKDRSLARHAFPDLNRGEP